jgi:hypothetical protein
MWKGQQANKRKIFCRASSRQRILAAVFFLAVVGSFGLLWLAQWRGIDIGWWLGPCGFKQRYGLPCPTCGWTTAMLTFARIEILEAFYIQPAAAFLCSIIVVAAFVALLTAIFGVYICALRRVFYEIKVRYIILALIIIIIIAAGWAVTLSRALAERS